ncbi:MAG TPA: VTT domain-containing protein [Patescibacteria group bacterium]|nr:VTT domain-containing protein [Patescibacteria group bacterium]
MTSKKKAAFYLIFILSFVLSLSLFIFKDFFRDSKSLGLFGIFLINFVSNASFFVSGPAFLSVIAGGSLYNPILVALVSSVAATLGDMIGFLVGFSGRKIILEKLEKKFWFSVLEDYFKKYGGLMLFFLAFIPNPFFDAIGLVAGIFVYSPKKFIIIVTLGRFLRYLILAGIGARI